MFSLRECFGSYYAWFLLSQIKEEETRGLTCSSLAKEFMFGSLYRYRYEERNLKHV